MFNYNFDPSYLETPYHFNKRMRAKEASETRFKAIVRFAWIAATVAIWSWLAIQFMGGFESARSMASIIQ